MLDQASAECDDGWLFLMMLGFAVGWVAVMYWALT